VYGHDIETKAGSSQWMGKSSRDHKSRSESIKCEGDEKFFFFWEERRPSRVCFTWSDSQWVGLRGGLWSVSGRQSEGRGLRGEGWRNKTWILNNNNATAHTFLLIREFLAKHETTVVSQQSHWTDLTPADTPPPRLNSTLKGRRFQTVGETEETLLLELRAILQNAFQNWKENWKLCIDGRGEYFEGDKS
jgi:hypothetical protein